MTGFIKLVINGSWFRARSTDFTFDPPLYKDVDYVQTVRGTGSDTSAQLVLKTGRAWRSDAASNDRSDLEFRWCLRLVETVSGEDDGECSGEPRKNRHRKNSVLMRGLY